MNDETESLTLDDVAAAANVSAATVSRWFNNPEIVAPATGERIRLAVEQLGYIPNLIAGGLASSRSRLVAVMIPQLANSIFVETIEAMIAELGAAGYVTMVSVTGLGESAIREPIRAALGRRAYVIPGGGSNALGALGYVACAQELQQQFFEQEVRIDLVVLGSGSSGTHSGLLVGFLGSHVAIPVLGIGVSRDPADQEPLVHRQAQATADLLGLNMAIPRSAVRSLGGHWQPRYSVPNAGMVEAVQLLARTEAILLDPVYTGKVMAGLIALARAGGFQPEGNILFLHTGGMPSLHAYEGVLLERKTP